jgi:hypothetical protein
MTQTVFASNATPSLSLLDQNFAQLYELRELFSTPGYAAATPRVTLDGGQNLLLGGKSVADLTSAGMYFEPSSGIGYGRLNFVKAASSGVGSTVAIGFYYNGGSVGSVQNTSTATTYNTTSDYRVKFNVAYIDGARALADVLMWPLREFEFLAVPGVRVAGALAHELQGVEPLAVSGEKDGEELQSVDWSKLVPKLAAAVQGLAAEVQRLRDRLDQA